MKLREIAFPKPGVKKSNSTMKVGPDGLYPARRGSTELRPLPAEPEEGEEEQEEEDLDLDTVSGDEGEEGQEGPSTPRT